MTTGMKLAQQAKADRRKVVDDADRRYYAALNEALPVGSPIRWSIGDRYRNGTVAGEWCSPGYVMVKNTHTRKTYSLATYHIEGLSG